MSDIVELDKEENEEKKPRVPGFTRDTNLAFDVPTRWPRRECSWCRWSSRDDHPEKEFEIHELYQHWARNTTYHFLRLAQPWQQQLRACWYHSSPYRVQCAPPNMQSDKSTTLTTTLPPTLVQKANHDFRIAGNQISNEKRPISQQITAARTRMHHVHSCTVERPGHAFPHLRSCGTRTFDMHYDCLRLAQPRRKNMGACRHHFPRYPHLLLETTMKSWQSNLLEEVLPPPLVVDSDNDSDAEDQEDRPPTLVDESDNEFVEAMQSANEDWQSVSQNIEAWRHTLTAALRDSRSHTSPVEAQGRGYAHPHHINDWHVRLDATAPTIARLGG